MLTAQQIIKALNLQPLPEEGGLFRETYRSEDRIDPRGLPQWYRQEKTFCTDIYYLLQRGTVSKLHRLRSDEIYHFHLGDPVQMLRLYPDGRSRVVTLGADILAGEQLQVVVPRDTWQGALLLDGEFALMSVTVAPSFDFADFESARAEELLRQYSDQAPLIRLMT